MNLKLITISDLYGKEGIPEEHAKVFLKVAKEKNVVIMTRTPGSACGMLLKQNYDAKSFWVKSKSCDWGPMAGFVCLDPLLNKSSIDGALDNLDYAHKSLTELYEYNRKYYVGENAHKREKGETVYKKDDNGKNTDVYDYTNVPKRASAIQICFDKQRLNWLLERGGTLGPKKKPSKITEIKSSDGTPSSFHYEFGDVNVLIKKEGELYGLYYDVVKLYGIENKQNLYESLAESFTKKMENWALETDKKAENTKKTDKLNEIKGKKNEKDKDKIKEFWKFLGEKKALKIEPSLEKFAEGKYKNYRPLMAMTNAHKAYKKKTDSGKMHLNALTGDYDLYAVWPKKFDKELDSRVAGMYPGLKDDDICKLEGLSKIGKVAGNITERIYEIGQTINSLIAYQPVQLEIDNKKEYDASKILKVNRVYHSDEGGRPYLRTADSAIGFSPTGEIFEISEKSLLSDAIVHFGVEGYCCLVNTGWEKELSEEAKKYRRYEKFGVLMDKLSA